MPFAGVAGPQEGAGVAAPHEAAGVGAIHAGGVWCWRWPYAQDWEVPGGDAGYCCCWATQEGTCGPSAAQDAVAVGHAELLRAFINEFRIC